MPITFTTDCIIYHAFPKYLPAHSAIYTVLCGKVKNARQQICSVHFKFAILYQLLASAVPIIIFISYPVSTVPVSTTGLLKYFTKSLPTPSSFTIIFVCVNVAAV